MISKTPEIRNSVSKAHSSMPFFNNSGKDSFFASAKQTQQSLFIQPKLSIGQPDDPYEREADKVADEVMRMPHNTIQLKCASCEDEEKIRQKPLIQQKMTGSKSDATVSPEISSKIYSTRRSGSPLPIEAQKELGAKIGADFSSVNIHTDDTAAQLSQTLGAKAFTVGNDIYFNKGQYNPASTEGKRLMAHELVHTIQQGEIIRKQEKTKKSSDEKALDKARLKIAQQVIGILFPWTNILSLFGWSTNGIGVGLQVSASVGEVAVVGAGTDFMTFYDFKDNAFAVNTFPFASISVGAEAGADGSLVCGLEIGPEDKAGGKTPGINYSGNSYGLGVSFGVSASVSVAEDITKGKAGWVVYTGGLGPKIGISVGGAKAVDAHQILIKADTIAGQIASELINQFFSSIYFKTMSGTVFTLLELSGKGVKTIEDIASLFGKRALESGVKMLGFSLYHELFGPWIPDNWNFSKYDKKYQKSLNHMVTVMWLNFNNKIESTHKKGLKTSRNDLVKSIREMERLPISNFLSKRSMSTNQWDATSHYNTIVEAFATDFGDTWSKTVVPALGNRGFFELEHREFIHLVTNFGSASIGDNGDYARDYPLDAVLKHK